MFAFVLVCSPVASIGLVGTATATPSGMATIPDTAISEDVPSGASIPLSASELRGGGVMASDHAGSLEVVLTTADHAESIMGPDGAAVSGDGMALVLRDDEHSAGRRVAVDAGKLKQALGYTPEAIYGTHENGEQWTASAEYVDGYLVFDVPHFSSNTVTFSGEITLSGTPTNGTSYQYSLASTDSIDNFSIELTGARSTEWDNVSATSVAPGTTHSLSVGGNLDPVGPSTDPELTLTASKVNNENGFYSSYDNAFPFAGPYNGGQKRFEYQIQNPPETITGIQFRPAQDVTLSSDARIVVGIDENGIDESTYTPNQVTWDPPDTLDNANTYTIPVETYRPDGSTVTVNIESQNMEADVNVDVSSTSNVRRSAYLGSWDTTTYAGDFHLVSEPTGVSVDANGGTYTYGNFTDGETKTQQLALDSTDTNLTINAQGGSFDYSLAMKERAVSEDPQVSVNGNLVSHQGVLSDGETTTLSTDPAWIESSNSVNVSFGHSYGADSPTPTVGFDYSHGASDQVVVDYEAAEFYERYNVSHTYADETTNATATIPFENSRITAIEYVDMRVDGGSWQTVDPADYRLDGTELTVYLADANGGSIPAGATVDLRTRGRSVETQNGAITVTDPTRPDEEYETKIRVDSRSDGFAINVGPTDQGDRVHYAWSNDYPTGEYAIIQADGDQWLHLPDAKASDQLYVSAVDAEATPATGDVRIEVVEAGESPEFDVSPGPLGSGDSVEWKYYETTTGVQYVLESLTSNIVRDSDTAESPAILTDDDSDELLSIFADSGGGSSSDGGDTVSRVVGQFRDASSGGISLWGDITIPTTILALLGGVVGVLYIGQRFRLGDDAAGIVSYVAGGIGATGRVAGRSAGSAASGGVSLLRRTLSTRWGLAGAGIVAVLAFVAVGDVRVGVLSLPRNALVFPLIVAVPIGSYLLLSYLGRYSRTTWIGTTGVAVAVGLPLVSPGIYGQIIQQSSDVWPILVTGVLVLAYLYLRNRGKEAGTPEEKNTIVFRSGEE